MKQLNDILTFADPRHEGLDSDTDEHILPKGHSRFRLNCRSGSTNGESLGVIENVKGDVVCTYDFTNPGVTRAVVGSCEDTTNDHIYYFVYAANLGYEILRYEVRTNTITQVLKDSILGFSKNYRIYNAKYLDGYLLWTDGINPPRQLDVQKAINHTLGISAGVDSYGTITTQILDVIKHPPKYAPAIEYGTDTTVDYNNLRGGMYQFAYRYIYDDKAKSTWSTYSKVSNPEGDELPDGRYYEDQTVNNYIKVSVDTGTDEVHKIEIAYRRNNESDFVSYDILERYNQDGTVNITSSTTYDYNFYNDKQGIGLDQTNFIRPYDYVPQFAGDQELINNERLVYADITEGYDNYPLDAVIQPSQTTVDLSDAVLDLTVSDYDHGGLIGWVWRVHFPSTNVDPGKVVRISSDQYILASYLVKAGDTLEDIKSALVAEVNLSVPNIFGKTFPLPWAYPAVSQLYFEIDKHQNVDSTDYNLTEPVGQILEPVAKYKNFKHGAYHQFGIVYYDRANRSGFVNTEGISDDVTGGTNSSGRVYVRYPSQNHASTLYTESYITYGMTWRINHRPPSWATHYQWVYAKNQSVASWLQYHVKDQTAIYRDSDGNIRIKLNDQIEVNNERLRHSVIGTYTFTKGDRMRFPYKRADIASNTAMILDDYLDIEILGQDESTGDIILPDFSPESYELLNSPAFYGFVLEVYTPRKDTSNSQVYYEIGECFEIGDPGTTDRYHKGGTQDQSPYNLSGVPATGVIEGGDSYVRLRWGKDGTTEEEYYYPVEAENYSDYYESDDFNFGRVNTVNKDAKQIQLTNYYRHGGRYVPLTQINQLWSFDYDEFESVSLSYGGITAIRQIGYTLKILQETKNTSQYIGRTSLLDASGQSSLQKSDQIFGTKVVSNDSYGCVDKGSVVANDRHLYFLDSNNGVYVRDSANGMFPISSYFMKNYWREMCEKLRTIGVYGYHISSIYDRKFDELNITITINDREAHQLFDDFTIIFHETSNRWKTFRSYIPDFYGKVGDEIVSFNKGQLYHHNQSELYNNFYGTQYNMELDVTSNIEAIREKVFDSLVVHSNKIFYCPEKGDLSISPDTNYPLGMLSRLKENKLVAIEGAFYSSILNDMSDPRFDNETEALFEGRNMRGRALKVKLTNTDTSHVELRFVTVKSTISEHTN